MKRLALAASLAVLIASPLAAADPDIGDPITLRKWMMDNVGGAMKLAGPMAKGETPFDARVGLAAFRVMNTAAMGFAAQFPAGSETGHDTEASPKIWEDRAGFDKAVAKFVADSFAAVKAAPADLDSFRAALGTVGENCKACHEAYRIKKN